jgi:hypothetical protein
MSSTKKPNVSVVMLLLALAVVCVLITFVIAVMDMSG